MAVDARTAILALPEAKGREALAEHLHASTDMSVEQVQATLKAAPAPAAEAPAPAPVPEPEPEADAKGYEASRLAGAGLGGAPKTAPAPRADLVGDMKRRHGIQA